MDLITRIQAVSPELIILVFSSVIAFVTWLMKTLVEAPIEKSRNTFEKYFEKRIQILSELNANLHFIAYFPKNTEFKENLQKVLLDGVKCAYISKEIFDNTTRIAIDKTTNEKLTLSTIQKIEDELDVLVSKIRQENEFYYKYTDARPFMRIFKVFVLFLMYLIAATIIFSLLLLIGYLAQKIVTATK